MSSFIFKKENGRTVFNGDFESLYRTCADPWEQGVAGDNLDSAMARFYGVSRRKLANELGKLVKSKSSVCEVGCGSGFVADFLAHELDHCVMSGCDVSPTAISISKSNFSSINFFTHDICQGPLPRTFHVVILSNILWYVIHDFGNVIRNSLCSLNYDQGTCYLVIQNALFKNDQDQEFGSDFVRTPGDLVNRIECVLHSEPEVRGFDHSFFSISDVAIQYDFALSIVSFSRAK
jgi:SAM-dependent methyltransferase